MFVESVQQPRHSQLRTAGQRIQVRERSTDTKKGTKSVRVLHFREDGIASSMSCTLSDATAILGGKVAVAKSGPIFAKPTRVATMVFAPMETPGQPAFVRR